MAQAPEQSARDRAIRYVRLVTLGGVGAALGLSWLFAVLSEAFFSGKPPTPPAPPNIPLQAAPVQKAPAVVVTIVHHPYKPGQTTSSGGTTPGAPTTNPAPAPPPPTVVCHSTPSKPC